MKEDSDFPIDKVWIDVSFTLLLLFVALYAILAMQSHAKTKPNESSALTGDIVISAQWDQGTDVDVDLWVQGPFDDKPVGYSRRSDKQTSYLRDDTGSSGDFTDLNYEIACIRGLKPGRYVVNVHLFNSRRVPTTHIKITATLNPQGHASELMATKQIVLTSASEGEEVTAFSFVLDKDGDLVVGSMSDVFIPLRSL